MSSRISREGHTCPCQVLRRKEGRGLIGSRVGPKPRPELYPMGAGGPSAPRRTSLGAQVPARGDIISQIMSRPARRRARAVGEPQDPVIPKAVDESDSDKKDSINY